MTTIEETDLRAETEREAAELHGGEAWHRGDPDYLLSPKGAVRGFGRKGFFVALIPCRLARAIIARHHYSRRFVNNSLVHVGVFGGGSLLGALQFGAPMNVSAVAKIVEGADASNSIELNRMWLDDVLPRNSESRALAYTFALLRRTRPAVGWVQSFSDERCRRNGVVYQAANFVYLGEHLSRFWLLDGEWYHSLAMTRISAPGPRGRHLQANRHRAQAFVLRQFRYAYFLNPSFRRRLLLPVLPYPKHAEQASMVTRPATSGESGVQIPGSAPFSGPL